MSHVHTASISWERDGAEFGRQQYSRAHIWRFDGGAEVLASSSPHVVRVPLSDPAGVDPEEAFVAALASCHMLTFLAFASRDGFVVDGYEDEAVGVLERIAGGVQAITKVTLRPRVTYSGAAPDPDTEEALHEMAHGACYIANSVKTEVVVEMPDR